MPHVGPAVDGDSEALAETEAVNDLGPHLLHSAVSHSWQLLAMSHTSTALHVSLRKRVQPGKLVHGVCQTEGQALVQEEVSLPLDSQSVRPELPSCRTAAW